MSARLQRAAYSPWTHATLLSAVALAVWLQHGFATAPILWDKAYFTYLGQAILRGEFIYTTTFMGYPPLGPLVSAGSMWVGGWFDLPTYLAPRCLALPLGALCVALVYVVSRRAIGGAWPGAIAAVALAGFHHFGASALYTLEPKLLVILFSLLAVLSSQGRHWWGAGLASGLAVICWQPAVLVPAVFMIVTLWGGRRSARTALRAYAAGFLVGILPAVTYLAATGTWWDFWQRSVMRPATSELPTAATLPLRWILIVRDELIGELALLVAGAAGFFWFALGSLRSGARGVLHAWLDPRLGGLPLLGLAWVGFNTVHFDGVDDLLLSLPVVAFWVAWLSHRLVELSLSRIGSHRRARALRHILSGGLLALTAAYAFLDEPSRRPTPTLAEEAALVRSIVRQAGPDGSVMCFSAEAVYVVSERRSPNRFLRLSRAFMPFLHLVEPDGCRGLLGRIIEQRPEVVVVNVWSRSSRCERDIGPQLMRNGYMRRQIQLRAHPRGVWNVYYTVAEADRENG